MIPRASRDRRRPRPQKSRPDQTSNLSAIPCTGGSVTGGRRGLQIQSGLHLAAVTGGAIYRRLFAFQPDDRLQLLLIDVTRHLNHLAGHLLLDLVVARPILRIVAMLATDAEGAAVGD